MRIASKNGFSTKVKNKLDRKQYVISTARHPSGSWETAVFSRNIFGFARVMKPWRVRTSTTLEEAEKEHSWCEHAVEELPRSQWANTRGKKFFYTTG